MTLNKDLPPYTYIPGYAPHPVSHPNGHQFGQAPQKNVDDTDPFLQGARLFNHGYFWEAHESWEHVWLELGRTSTEALLIKGLIKLAASAVKCREGNLAGTKRHAARAFELLSLSCDETRLISLIDLSAATSIAKKLAESPPIDVVPPSSKPYRYDFPPL